MSRILPSVATLLRIFKRFSFRIGWDMCLRYDSISSREVSQVSLFGLVDSQDVFSPGDFLSSGEILIELWYLLQSANGFGARTRMMIVCFFKFSMVCQSITTKGLSINLSCQKWDCFA
jgi:hypothetical protein